MALRQRGLEGLWLKALMFVLFGYALLDKGFAYFWANSFCWWAQRSFSCLAG